GLGSVLYYLFAYAFMNLGAFGVLAYLSRDGKECENYEDISGLWSKKPLIAIALGIFLFSLAGVPPTIGFFAKYQVFLSAIKADFYWLAIIGILNSVISAYYYLRVLVYAYMKEDNIQFPSFKPASAFAITILTIATLILGIFPFHSWDLALKAAVSFLANQN
ncbi:MAG: NADH-quinone oxidoreductase subunit N, partial [Thermodesulfobacteriota bacterium]